MNIRGCIQDLLRERLASTECLVLYDPDARYRALETGLVNEQCQVVDGSFSTIQAREQATDLWLSLEKKFHGAEQLLNLCVR
jgi:hypothetical protein